MPTAFVGSVDDDLVNQFIQHFRCKFFRVGVLSDTFEELLKVIGFLLSIVNERPQFSNDLPHLSLLLLILRGELIKPLRGKSSSLFESWFEEQLLPALPPDTVVVMDNASFHRKAQLIPVAQKYGFRLIFLPPYSPELNPIENFWAWLKRYLRSALSSYPSFDLALFDAFQVC